MDADIPTDHPPTQSFAPPPRNVRLRDWAQDQRVIAAMAIGVLALVSFFSLPQVFVRWYATSFGSPVQATVRYRYRAEPTEHHSRYRMQFEYSQGGQDFTQTDEIGQPQFENLDLGSPLPGKAAHLLGADYCYTGLDRSENINMPRAGLIMLWIVLPIGIAYAVRNARRQIRLLESGAAAHGTVTAKRKMAGKATTFYVSYQFSADQTQFAKEMQVPRSVFNSMEAGSAITVFYDPSDPTQNVAQELCRYQIA